MEEDNRTISVQIEKQPARPVEVQFHATISWVFSFISLFGFGRLNFILSLVSNNPES